MQDDCIKEDPTKSTTEHDETSIHQDGTSKSTTNSTQDENAANGISDTNAQGDKKALG